MEAINEKSWRWNTGKRSRKVFGRGLFLPDHYVRSHVARQMTRAASFAVFAVLFAISWVLYGRKKST
jgi:hypothetical protein